MNITEEARNQLRADYRNLMSELEYERKWRSQKLSEADATHEASFSAATDKARKYWRGRLKKTEENIAGLKRLGAALGAVLATPAPAQQPDLFTE